MFRVRGLLQFIELPYHTIVLLTRRSYFALNKMSSVKELVDRKIAGKKVMIFSKTYCPFCTKAKKVFQKLIEGNLLSTEDYEVMEIENDSRCEQIQNYLHTVTGARSVPRVFINGKCIGGGDDVVEAHQSGQLVKMLA